LKVSALGSNRPICPAPDWLNQTKPSESIWILREYTVPLPGGFQVFTSRVFPSIFPIFPAALYSENQQLPSLSTSTPYVGSLKSVNFPVLRSRRLIRVPLAQATPSGPIRTVCLLPPAIRPSLPGV